MNEVQPMSMAPGAMRLPTVKLVELFREGKPGDTHTDEALAKHCGHNTAVGQPGYGYLQTAIKYCLREYGIVWRRQRGENKIECLNDIQKVDFLSQERKGIRRRTKRGMHVAGAVVTSNLNDEDRTKHWVQTALFGSMLAITAPETTKKLAQKPETKAMDVAGYLTAMTGE